MEVGGRGGWGTYIQGAYRRMYFFLQVDGPMTGWGGGYKSRGDFLGSLTYPASTGIVSSFKQGRFSHLAIIRNFFFFQGWPSKPEQNSTAGHFWNFWDSCGYFGALASGDTSQSPGPDSRTGGSVGRGLQDILLQKPQVCEGRNNHGNVG